MFQGEELGSWRRQGVSTTLGPGISQLPIEAHLHQKTELGFRGLYFLLLDPHVKFRRRGDRYLRGESGGPRVPGGYCESLYLDLKITVPHSAYTGPLFRLPICTWGRGPDRSQFNNL